MNIFCIGCGYKLLKNIAQDEGNPLTSIPNAGLPHSKCNDRCDKLSRCLSLAYCPENRCYFYDKQISENDPQKVNHGCFTSYKTCTSGKKRLIA